MSYSIMIPAIADGVRDPGFGLPEIGCVRLSEIRVVRGCLGLPVERALFLTADATLSACISTARIKVERQCAVVD